MVEDQVEEVISGGQWAVTECAYSLPSLSGASGRGQLESYGDVAILPLGQKL